jgi:hypothetical protein
MEKSNCLDMDCLPILAKGRPCPAILTRPVPQIQKETL